MHFEEISVLSCKGEITNAINLLLSFRQFIVIMSKCNRRMINEANEAIM